MKLSLAIILASVLLLSVGQNVSVASPNPTPTPLKTGETEQHQGGAVNANAGEQHGVTSSAMPTVNQIPTALPTPPSNGNADQDGKETPPNWLIIFTGVLAAVGIAQFCAMLRQASYMRHSNILTRATLRAVQRQAKAGEDQVTKLGETLAATQIAALAADKSAGLAERALNSNRPFLLVVDEAISDLASSIVHTKFAFKNCGHSPALVSTIHARLAVTKAPTARMTSNTFPNVEAFPEFGSFEMYGAGAMAWLDKQSNVLVANEESTPYDTKLATHMYSDVEPSHLKPELLEGVRKHTLLIVLHGVINYRDILRQEYSTEFRGFMNYPSGAFNFEFKDREQTKDS